MRKLFVIGMFPLKSDFNSWVQKKTVFPDSMDTTESFFQTLDQRVREETKVSVDEQGSVRFSVWVSFAEIYNEQIYDLLVPMPKKKNARRQVLKLSEDKHGSPYIKGNFECKKVGPISVHKHWLF